MNTFKKKALNFAVLAGLGLGFMPVVKAEREATGSEIVREKVLSIDEHI